MTCAHSNTHHTCTIMMIIINKIEIKYNSSLVGFIMSHIPRPFPCNSVLFWCSANDEIRAGLHFRVLSNCSSIIWLALPVCLLEWLFFFNNNFCCSTFFVLSCYFRINFLISRGRFVYVSVNFSLNIQSNYGRTDIL